MFCVNIRLEYGCKDKEYIVYSCKILLESIMQYIIK